MWIIAATRNAVHPLAIELATLATYFNGGDEY
jgi:hypothetical protein